MQNPACNSKGFSLIELLIYVSIFAISSVFLVAILTSVTQVQVRQKSMNEVNHQISFVSETAERLIQESSLVDIDAGVTTSTLVLRMTTSSLDSTKIFASGTIVFLQEGTSTAIGLTDSRIKVDKFSVVKLENPGSRAIVNLNLAMSYNTSNIRAKFSRAIQFTVARISAASFDSSLLPNANSSYDLGNTSYNWRDAYFNGNIGVGTAPSSSARIIARGDIGVSTSSKGLILTSANGTCYRITITNGGSFSTSSVTCP